MSEKGDQMATSPYPPEQQASNALDQEIGRLQGELGKRLRWLEEHQNSRQTLVQWSRKVTEYKDAKGQLQAGKPDYRTIFSIDRLERSIADADWHLGKLDAMKPGEVKL